MRVLIVGLGKSGLSAIRLLKKFHYQILVYDKNRNKMLDVAREHNVSAVILPEQDVVSCDLVVVSPGVLENDPIVRIARRYRIEIISELELGYRYMSSDVIAVTGTNGKTSTVNMIKSLLQATGISCDAAGNIGLPYTSLYDDKKIQVVVLEVSSFQLMHSPTFAPKISIITNIAPDHLDRHKSMREYIRVKNSLLKNAHSRDRIILNADDVHTKEISIPKDADVCFFSMMRKVSKGVYCTENEIRFSDGTVDEKICSINRIESISPNHLIVLTVAMIQCIPFSVALDVIGRFVPESNTMTRVRTVNGVTYINDSKSTNISATLYATRRIDEDIVLLLGGRSKGEDYINLAKNLPSNVKHLILFGENAQELSSAMDKIGHQYTTCNKLCDAVAAAHDVAKSGDTVLLSPASCSFDVFDNYAKRGEEFVKAVMCL